MLPLLKKNRFFLKLVSYWRFDESSWDGMVDELEDSSINGNDGRMT